MKLIFLVLLAIGLTVEARFVSFRSRRSPQNEQNKKVEAAPGPLNDPNFWLRNLVVGPPVGAPQILLNVNTKLDDDLNGVLAEALSRGNDRSENNREGKNEGGNAGDGNDAKKGDENKKGETSANQSNQQNEQTKKSEENGKSESNKQPEQNGENDQNKPSGNSGTEQKTENAAEQNQAGSALPAAEANNNAKGNNQANDGNNANENRTDTGTDNGGEGNQNNRPAAVESTNIEINFGEAGEATAGDNQASRRQDFDRNGATDQSNARDQSGRQQLNGQYVAKNRGAVHIAPLSGHAQSVKSSNYEPAPGTTW